jgi:hypothetical protein
MQYLTISTARDAVSILCFREAEDSNRVKLTYPYLRADEFAPERSTSRLSELVLSSVRYDLSFKIAS